MLDHLAKGTEMIEYETSHPDRCPVCRVHGMQPCQDDQGNDVPDHDGRPVQFANTGEY